MEQKRDNSGNLGMVIAGITLLCAAVIGLGVAIRELCKAKRLLAVAEQCSRTQDNAISKIAQNAIKILQRRVSKLAGYSIATSGLLLGGAALFVAGFFAIPIVGQVGIVVSVVFGVYLLYNMASHWSDSEDDSLCYRAKQDQRSQI